jgi:integrase
MRHRGRGSSCQPYSVALDSKNMGARHWKRAITAAALDSGRQHDLRHSFAAWQAQAGASLDELADLGHSSTRTNRHYRST